MAKKVFGLIFGLVLVAWLGVGIRGDCGVFGYLD
jgi:hypothetical protein